MPFFQNSSDHLRLLVAAILLGRVGSASADVQLPNIFSDSMVLQRGQENRVWGRADAGEKVTVTIADQSHQATADADGNWHVMLAPLSVGTPLELAVKGMNEIRCGDVLVGGLFLWAATLSDDRCPDRSDQHPQTVSRLHPRLSR